MTLREALQDIYERRGQLDPDIVLEEARPVSSPIHDRFEWDDSVAAEAWRKEQAHELIRSVKVVYAKPDTDQRIEIRQWHAVSSPTGHTYEPLEKVSTDPLLRQLVLRDMEREWRQLKGRYETFSEFTTMVLGDLGATG